MFYLILSSNFFLFICYPINSLFFYLFIFFLQIIFNFFILFTLLIFSSISDSFPISIQGHLNGIDVCSKTIKHEVGKIMQYKYLQNS